MWGVTAYFNFLGYRTKKRNFDVFREHSRKQGLPLIAVEAALPGRPFELEPGDAEILIQRRATAVLWQKERLLNIGLGFLPEECDAVAWLDADMVFSDNAWVGKTRELLKRYAVVQPYEEARYLARGGGVDDRVPVVEEMYRSAAWMAADSAFAGRVTGATGLAMACRREALPRCGLLDRMILGGADTVMIGAFLGVPVNQLEHIAYLPLLLQADAEHWWRQAWESVHGSVGYLPGTAYALWHGDRPKRRYADRQWLLNGFDPAKDILIDAEGCWAWNSNNLALRRNIRDYFLVRDEDGTMQDEDATHMEREVRRCATRARLSQFKQERMRGAPGDRRSAAAQR